MSFVSCQWQRGRKPETTTLVEMMTHWATIIAQPYSSTPLALECVWLLVFFVVVVMALCAGEPSCDTEHDQIPLSLRKVKHACPSVKN